MLAVGYGLAGESLQSSWDEESDSACRMEAESRTGLIPQNEKLRETRDRCVCLCVKMF